MLELAVSPAITSIGNRTGGSCFRVFPVQKGPPLYGVLFPDWIKWAGILENVFSLLLHEQGGGETWVTNKTLYNSDYCWHTQRFNSYFIKIKKHLQQL